MESKLLYSIKEACAALGIARSTLYSLIGAGRIEVLKVGRRTLLKARSVRAFAGEDRPDAA